MGCPAACCPGRGEVARATEGEGLRSTGARGLRGRDHRVGSRTLPGPAAERGSSGDMYNLKNFPLDFYRQNDYTIPLLRGNNAY